jgi:hypothetical protein
MESLQVQACLLISSSKHDTHSVSLLNYQREIFGCLGHLGNAAPTVLLTLKERIGSEAVQFARYFLPTIIVSWLILMHVSILDKSHWRQRSRTVSGRSSP